MLLHLTPGTPTVGHWCEACLLPSLIKVPVNLVHEDGVSPLGTAEYCDSCQKREMA